MILSREPDDPRLTRVQLRRELIAAGWSDQALASAVRGGLLVRPRRGAYVDGPTWARLDACGRHEVRARAVLHRADAPLVVSHVSGLVFYDGPGWGLDLAEVDVTRPHGRGERREAGIRPHRGKILEGDVTPVHGVPVMSPTRLALEVATVLDLETSLVHINDLVHRRLTTLSRIKTRYEQSMDRWPHSLQTNLVLRLVDGRCESVAESRTLFLCWRQGLPMPVPQYPIRDESGRVVAYADFAWPELGAFMEFDGKVKYAALIRPGETAADVVLREKLRERLITRLTGWRCIRLVWADLSRPEATALDIRRVLYPAGLAA